MLFNLIYTLFTFFQASVSTHPVPQAGRCTRSLRARVRKADAPDAYFYFHMQIPGRLPPAPARRRSWSSAHADAKRSSIPAAPTQAERSLELEADPADAHPFPMPPLRLPILYKYPIDRRLPRQPCGGAGDAEDAAVAHSCLPQAPPISAPAPVTDAGAGNRAGKNVEPGPRAARGDLGVRTAGWHLQGRLGGTGTARLRGCSAPVTRQASRDDADCASIT